MPPKVERLFLGLEGTLRNILELLDETACGIVLVVDDDRRLLGTVTDGDVRRAILAGLGADTPIAALLARRRREPATAPHGMLDSDLLHLMAEESLRHVPLVDAEGRIAGIALLSELVREYELPLRAVVMAGGLGTRLGELTEDLPKPMLPIGDRPLLERIIEQLREAGVQRVNLTTHYRAEAISSYFGDGERFGVELQYVHEDEPLGTAGALGLLDHSDEPILVMNGDILTRIDFRAMLEYHQEHGADMTIAVRPYELRVPYGLVETRGEAVVALSEKPLVQGFANAGIYLLEPAVCRDVPSGLRLDMTELIERLLEQGRSVVSFPLREYWLDIGQLEDYERALLEHRDA